MSVSSKDIERRRDVRHRLIEALLPSVGGRPKDAEYVVNNLTVHRLELLAEAALTFAKWDVERLLTSGDFDGGEPSGADHG